jgi:hypothetical protein
MVLLNHTLAKSRQAQKTYAGACHRRGSSLAQPHAWMHHAALTTPLHNATVARPIRWVPAIETLRIEERAGPRVPAIQPCSYRRTTEAPVRRRIPIWLHVL